MDYKEIPLLKVHGWEVVVAAGCASATGLPCQICVRMPPQDVQKAAGVYSVWLVGWFWKTKI